MRLIVRWFIVALSLLFVAEYVPGIEVSGFYIALIIALILGLVNALVRPVLVLLTLPITIVTLGLFVLFLNAFLFWFVSTFVKGFEVDGIVPAFIGSLVVSALSFLGNRFLSALDKRGDE